MRTLTRGNFRSAIKTIRTHRGRSFFTMLGIIIGIASVVTVVSIGEGVKHQVSGQINRVGNNLITVRPGTTATGGLNFFTVPRADSSLSDKDVATVQHTPGVATATPLAMVAGTANSTEHGAYHGGSVVAAGDELPRLLNQTIAYGAFFGPDDAGQHLAVLGQQAAIAMFDTEVPLGQTFTFRGQEFMVRGIFNEFAVAPLSSDINFNTAIYIPYTTAQALTSNTVLPYEILAKSSTTKQLDSAANAIKTALLKNHGDTHDFSVLKASDSLAQTSSVLNLLTELIAGAAAVALFVGGIGIANITLVSVTERMHEVGIRKAVGATNRQILNEFIAEAVVLSVAGGIFGVIVSLAVDIILRITTNLAPIMQWQVVVGATLVSMCIGILFGSVPALKAARKDPIAALRGQ